MEYRLQSTLVQLSRILILTESFAQILQVACYQIWMCQYCYFWLCQSPLSSYYRQKLAHSSRLSDQSRSEVVRKVGQHTIQIMRRFYQPTVKLFCSLESKA